MHLIYIVLFKVLKDTLHHIIKISKNLYNKNNLYNNPTQSDNLLHINIS